MSDQGAPGETPPRGKPAPRPIARLRGAFAEQASEFTQGHRPPATPRDSASVLLLRAAAQGPPGIEVCMLRRVRSMAFAPGASAFPGGSVDPADADDDVYWAGPAAANWASLLDAPAATARALVCAAVRETFEECGVLLAGPAADSVLADTSGADWETDREAVAGHTLSLAQLLGRRRLVLRSDLLYPWAHWITPEPQARRFDTRFFAAALPAGQQARLAGGESEEVTWLRPADALQAARDGELDLMPPTASCLAGLLPFTTVPGALAAERDMNPVTPEVIEADGAFWLSVPADVDYPL